MKGKILLRLLPPLLAAILLALLPRAGGAKVYLDINAPSSRQMPVAVTLPVPLDGQAPDTSLAEEIQSVMTADLEFSGIFRMLRPFQFAGLEAPNAGVQSGTFDFAVWAELTTAEALVKTGYFRRPDGKLEIEFHLYDVIRREELASPGRRLAGTAGQIREMVHRFSDLLVREITGEEGIFSTRILYLQDAGRGKEIRMMDYDGFNYRPVTANGSINLAPAWWPDGTGLIYTSYKDGSPDLYSLGLRGGETRLTKSLAMDVGAALSPDGRILAFAHAENGNSDIYLAEPATGRFLARLTTLPSVDTSPSWSPDARRIAFVSDRYGTPQVCVMNADGSGQRRITFDGGYNSSPAWSPRGDLIAYSSRVDGKFAVWVIHPDTLEARPLVEGGNNEDPCWSPDGRFIAFASDREGEQSQIYVVDKDGKRPETRLTSGPGVKTAPAWSPRYRP